jgi:predicted enzyme related to lactoylglutathione lyase
MGTRTTYSPGTFSWTDLSTTDQAAAKEFYAQLFGWEFDDMPAGDGVMYSMAKLDGQFVGAIAPQNPAAADAGAPAAWQSYVTVPSADETVEKARNLGATIHAPAFDVMDAGRMAVIQDPQGAFFLPWQPNRHIGAGLVNAPGAMVWNELAARDLTAAASFYSELFGWAADPMEGSEPPYWTIKTADGHNNGGMRPVMPPEAPPHWLVYFGSGDIDRDAAKAGELGGTQLVPPMDIGMGKIAVFTDPQGAVFAMFGGQFED